MDDLSSKINDILSDPQALQQIKGLGEKLGLNNASNKVLHNAESKNDDVSNLLSNIPSLGSNDTLSMISRLAPLMSSINKEDDTTRLLFALRPFLSQERQKKLDEASKLIRMMKLLPLVKDFGILDSLF